MRQPKIIDELNDSVVTVIQLVLTIHNPKGNGKCSFKVLYVNILQDNWQKVKE